MSTILDDIKYAIRMLRKRPGFTAISLTTLALGIGANMTVFTAVNALLLRPPMSVKHPDQLVGCQGVGSYLAYLDMRDNCPVFSDLTGYCQEEISLRFGDDTERTMGYFVPANYFSTLGVAPVLGRGFLSREDRLGAERVAVLTHHAWERYGGDPDILGRELLVNGWPCQVIGVMPKGFTGTSLMGPAIWIPWGLHYQMLHETDRKKRISESTPSHLKYPWIAIIGRLKPGLSMSEAQAHLAPIMSREDTAFKSRFPLYRLPRLVDMGGGDDRDGILHISAFLLGTSALILFIACLNLANMYLVQGTSRQQELAIRTALGSSRWRLIRQLLVESLLLALLGGLGGVLMTLCGMSILNRSLATLSPPMGMTLSMEAGFDMRVFGATLVFTTIAALWSSLWPAFRLSQCCVTADLKEVRGSTGRSVGSRRRILPPGMAVVGQVALSVVLVMGAGLFTHNAVKVAYATPGYSWDGKLHVGLDFNGTPYSDIQRQQLRERLIEHLSALPGVQTVGMSDQIPFGDRLRFDYISPLGQDLDDDPRTLMQRGVRTGVQAIDSRYLQSVGLPLLQGRFFTSLEIATGAPVVIISEALARQLQPDGDILGILISKSRRIVGIVPNVRQQILQKEMGPQLYQPLRSDTDLIHLTVRLADSTRAMETTLLRTIRQEIRSVDPQLSVVSATRLKESHRKGLLMWFLGMLSRLSIASGIIALFLAGLGIYGVKSYRVASRTPEIGIRMALGATHRGILVMVLGEGALVTLVGLSIGMWAALSAARLMRSVLSDVDPVDPLSIALTVILLGSASLLASYIPARRAAKIDPIAALRYE